jgi:hypothetical protein
VTPIDHFEAVWMRCSELSALHAYLASNVSAVLHPQEVLRAEWVSRVSALDLYIHELTAQRMIDIFEGRLQPTPAYGRFVVSNETLNRIRQAIVNHGSVSLAPAAATAAFDLYVRTDLGKRTFQRPDDIADAVRLFSGVELWNEVALKLGAPPAKKSDAAKDIKLTLSLVVERRNKIAHEGDLQPPPLREPWPINQADVAYVAEKLEQIVRAIDAIV